MSTYPPPWRLTTPRSNGEKHVRWFYGPTAKKEARKAFKDVSPHSRPQLHRRNRETGEWELMTE